MINYLYSEVNVNNDNIIADIDLGTGILTKLLLLRESKKLSVLWRADVKAFKDMRWDMKKFNVTGTCIAQKHYMVDISGKIEKIKTMIDDGRYFTINRARQYGKTTTLSLLAKRLQDEYIVIRMSFEGVGDECFISSESFCEMFMYKAKNMLKAIGAEQSYADAWYNDKVNSFRLLGSHIERMCEGKKVVLMIDEVDKSSNNRIFLQFLGVLREKFLFREEGIGHTFFSVILAGVYDVKNIKLKMINEGTYEPMRSEGMSSNNNVSQLKSNDTSVPQPMLYNSPWNIAANFNVDMSFHPLEIATMLDEYEEDNHIGMDVGIISQEIYNYTSGYPFLVSRICQLIDEELGKNWTVDGVQAAVKIILNESNTLFDDLFKNLENNNDLYNLIYDILITGQQRISSKGSPVIKLGIMFGIIDETDSYTVICNRIFEIVICNYFIAKDEEKRAGRQITGVLQYDIVRDGRFDMELCLRKFSEHYREIFHSKNTEDMAFLERHGRMVFLSYLKPLINGQGFYHIESQFTDLRRMDIVVDFGRDQFIIELKLWRGEGSHEDAL